jgi:TonB family protein
MKAARAVAVSLVGALVVAPTVWVQASVQASKGDPPAWFRSSLDACASNLAQIDQEIARALAEIGTASDAGSAEALGRVREQANLIVYRATQALGDDYPCKATTLPAPADLEDLPSPEEFVAFDEAPELVTMDTVEYPKSARDARVEGTVLVRVLVGKEGRVLRTMVIQSVPQLDGAAVKSARSAVFKPAEVQNEPVAVWMVIPIEFALHQND